MFTGVNTAIVTPFNHNGIDFDAYERLVERQVEAGVDGIVPCGTTGESSTLSDTEIIELVRRTIQVVNGRCAVIAGIGTNDTARTIRLAQEAQSLGADGGLVITPYYNKPGQEGLYAHCAAVANAAPKLPIVLYNVPGRTGVSFTVETIVRLAQLPTVVALKDATADMAFASHIVARCGDDLSLLSGDDITALPQWSVGGRGVVSVTSNLLPDRMVELWSQFKSGNLESARRIHTQLLPLFDGLFMETNPVPIKTLVAQHTGLCVPTFRLPLTPIGDETMTHLRRLCASLEIELAQ